MATTTPILGQYYGRMAPVIHIVIFQYKSSATAEQKKRVAQAFLALRDDCLAPVHPYFPDPGKPYIQSIVAGSNTSLEEAAQGYDHVFVVTFASPEQRDYYVDVDPAHAAFKSVIKSVLERIVVTDFSDGEWK